MRCLEQEHDTTKYFWLIVNKNRSGAFLYCMAWQ